MYRMRAIVANILVAYVISCSAISGFFFPNPPAKLHQGTLTPLDPDVCTLQNVTFTCTLLSPPNPSNSIGFAVKNESTNKEYLPIDDGRVRVINETSSEFTMQVNATTYFFVNCFYWETFGDVDDMSQQLDHTSTASVYPMPEKVDEINCVVENYIKSMKCSWNYGEKYEGGLLPNVKFQWRIPEYSGSWNNCSDLNTKDGYCNWNSSRNGDFTMKLIDIKLTLSEPCGISVPSNFTIDTRKIVKPNPVIGLISSVLNSTCIGVQWRTNNSEMQYPKEHRVIVSSKWEDPQVYTFSTTENTEKDTHRKTFCNLYPHTVYTFSVSIQPTGEQAGFYSDLRETEAATYSDIPSASPSVTEGGYSWTPRDCEETNSKRQVCVFWKPIQEEDKNGQMKGLDGSFTAVQKSRTPIDVNWAEDLTYGCSAGLLCNTSYIFSIKARNSNGTSVENSTLLISATTLGIAQPQFIVEVANSSNVSVSWEESGKASGYMVAWCRNKNGECENRNKVYWEKFSSDMRKAVIEINQENSPQDFLYGVSVLTEQGNSGVEWQDCVYLKNAEPKREPQNVVVSAGSEDNTLVVTWDKLACKSDQPYIAMYELRYNKLNDGNQKAVNVPASGEARAVLKGLEDGQTYIVTVRGITKDGERGPESEPRKGVPIDYSLKPDEIVGIILGVFVVVLFAAVGCVCMIRKIRKRAKRNIQQLGDITIPEDINLRCDGQVEEDGIDRMSTRSRTSVGRQNSNDSGYDPMTPPTDKLNEGPKFDPSVLNNRPSVRPDGYCLATVENGQIPNIGNHTLELDSMDSRFNNFIPTEPVVARVGFVMNGSNRNSGETFVKKVDNDTVSNETAVKARTKNDSGDSGVSDAYTKATLGRSEVDDICEDVDETNVDSNNDAHDYVSDDKVINSCPKIIYNTRESEHVTPQVTSKTNNKIPKPSAFSECSDSDSSLSDQENDQTSDHVLETSVGTSVDYVKAQPSLDYKNSTNCNQDERSTITTNINSDYFQSQLSELEIQNIRNEDNESNSDKVSRDISFQPLTNIPRPSSMDESDTASIEEENVSSPTQTGASASQKVPQSGTNESDYIVVTNDEHFTLPQSSILESEPQQVNVNDQTSNYVTATNTPNLSVKSSPQQQANSGTGYVVVPKTGTNISSPTPNEASTSQKVPQMCTNRGDYIEVTNDTPTLPPDSILNSASHPENVNNQTSDYVTTTYTPNLSVKSIPQKQANSGTGYATLPKTGTNVSENQNHAMTDQLAPLKQHQKPYRAYVPVSESLTREENADASLGYVTSVTSPNVSHSSMNSSPVVSHAPNNPPIQCNLFSKDTDSKVPSVHSQNSSNIVPNNLPAGGYTSHCGIGQGSVIASSAPISMASREYVPHIRAVQGQMSPDGTAQNPFCSPDVQNFSAFQGYMPRSSVDEGQMFDNAVVNDIASTVAEGSSVSCSASEGDVTHPDFSHNLVPTSSDSNHVSESNSMQNSLVENTSGYVTSTGSFATPSSMTSADTDVKPECVDSTVNETDSKLTENNSYIIHELINKLPDKNNHGFKQSSESEKMAFHNGESQDNVPNKRNTMETNEHGSNIVQTGEMKLPNGYVDHQFISRGNSYGDQPLSNNIDQPIVGMGSMEKQENGNDQCSKRSSDSGLSSLDNESPDMHRKQQDLSNGYISQEMAKSLQQ